MPKPRKVVEKFWQATGKLLNKGKQTIPKQMRAESKIRQLGKIKNIPALEGLLKDPDWEVRLIAVETLGETRDARATHALEKALADSAAWVREEAIKALGKIGDASAVTALERMLNDSNPGIRRNAAKTLEEIKKHGRKG